MITQDELKQILHYEPTTGVFTWLIGTRKIKIGDVAGTDNRGYKVINISGKLYRAHRLAWLYMYGVFPNDQLDHINRVRDDNRIANLREATPAENQQNCGKRRDNTSGITGLYWHKPANKWQVRIKKDGRLIHIGLFDNLTDAIDARREAELKYHPFKA